MVGAHRVELWTSCLSSKRSNQLSYTPKWSGEYSLGSPWVQVVGACGALKTLNVFNKSKALRN